MPYRINQIAGASVDLLLWPVASLSPFWQAFALGLPAAVIALLVFRAVSNQEGIERAKDRVKAHLLEMRLFRDDLRVGLGAQAGLLRANLTYLRHALLPLFILIGPFLLLLIQLESRVAFRGLEVGEQTLLTLTLDPGQEPSALAVTLRTEPGLSAETPALRIDADRQLVWRLRALAAGTQRVDVGLDGHAFTTRVEVGETDAPVALFRHRAGDWNALLYPAEPLADGPVASVALDYPRRLGAFAGLSSASWVFFGSSLLFGYALRGWFGVTF